MSLLDLAKRVEAGLRRSRPGYELDERNERLPVADAPADALARLLPMPLDVFALAGQPIEIRVAWWPETLWFVLAVRDVEVLCGEGIGRHRVWTAGELIALLAASPLTTTALATVMRARAAFDGEVVEVRPR